ncbi:MAG: IS21 family transposase [Calditrichaeota bacterium]|nr:MAG: IS21 family transposase [Calditrichota bacterium]
MLLRSSFHQEIETWNGGVMAYKQMRTMDIYQIISRWHAGYNISQISTALGVDRKTVRHYIRLAQKKAGIKRGCPLPKKDNLLATLASCVPQRKYTAPARDLFLPHKDEIIELITQKNDPLKPKTAYEVICERHGLTASYTSFRRFMHQQTDVPELSGQRATTCRFETAPGEEVQIDYAKMGRLFDPATGRNRDVYAFIATLSYSRLKFVEFVYKQDQRSFVASHVRMFEFFEGAPKRLVIDNLKAGVLKPDVYLPHFNRAYQDMAEHYGCFIDPARPYHPKDKAKVERTVPQVRELFRKLKALYPHLEIAQGNREARTWCLESNGMKVHGTTGRKPFEAFQEIEKAALRPLPLHHFEIPNWKQAKVHVDQFIQFEKRFYSVPEKYVGQQVWVKATEKVVQIYFENTLIKKHLRGQSTRQLDPKDFPDQFRVMLDDNSIRMLLTRSERIGPAFKALLVQVLTPHAKLNYRRALALLKLEEHYDKELLDHAAKVAKVYKIHTPRQFKTLIERLSRSNDDQTIPLSPETQQLLREPAYFIH